jgi:hypothetical protein
MTELVPASRRRVRAARIGLLADAYPGLWWQAIDDAGLSFLDRVASVQLLSDGSWHVDTHQGIQAACRYLGDGVSDMREPKAVIDLDTGESWPVAVTTYAIIGGERFPVPWHA